MWDSERSKKNLIHPTRFPSMVAATNIAMMPLGFAKSYNAVTESARRISFQTIDVSLIISGATIFYNVPVKLKRWIYQYNR